MAETFALPESSNRDRELHDKVVKDLELKRKIRQVVVPTDDGKVRQLLRQLGEPITLFGEREMERRERLKRFIAEREGQIDLDLPTANDGVIVEEVQVQKELFYTEGTDELREARLGVAHWSLKRAKERLLRAKRRRDDPEVHQDYLARQSHAAAEVRKVSQQCSELGGDRPISYCQFSPDGAELATCGWGGALCVWAAPSCQRRFAVRAHEERCTGVAWHPQAGTSQSELAVNLATGSADNTARLFTANGDLLRQLDGHSDRLGRVSFHPMGRHLATASFDGTWRLWDIESGVSLLEQEGHSRAVYAVAFHPDGSLAGSVGLDAYGRIFDCRTGRGILVLEGHVRPLMAIDFSPNGYHVATGSDDNTSKIWDLRTKKCIYTIPGHRSLVSCVRFEPCHGSYLLTAGYDCVAKVWSGRDWSLLRTLAGHEGKVMGADVSPRGDHMFATVAYDRTIKFWAPEEV